MTKNMILGLLLMLAIAGFRAESLCKVVVNQSVVAPAVAKDSVLATRAVLNLLNWYKSHIDSVSRIILVNQKPGKNYSVNLKNGERYLAYLRSSHLVTDSYLNEWRVYFRERQKGFELSPQNEGPPTGFEYDLVLLSQDVDMQLNSLKKLKISKVTIHKDTASVLFELLANYEFRLVRKNGIWQINDILNLSAE